MSVGGDSEEVSKGRGEEGGELSFREEFEEGGFMVVKGRLEGCHELHIGERMIMELRMGDVKLLMSRSRLDEAEI
jgi:hypothetical protein